MEGRLLRFHPSIHRSLVRRCNAKVGRFSRSSAYGGTKSAQSSECRQRRERRDGPNESLYRHRQQADRGMRDFAMGWHGNWQDWEGTPRSQSRHKSKCR